MATNYAKASYTEIYDIETIPSTPTILGVHTPEIKLPYEMLGGFFRQFRKFRYAGCDISFVPVATLPLDPLQVGFEAGQSPPQDLVNPILHKAFMGESLGGFIDTVFPQFESIDGSVDYTNYNETSMQAHYEDLYYQALSDPHFLKSGVQVGFKRDGLVPLVRRVNSDMQFGPYYPRDNAESDTDGIPGTVGAYQDVSVQDITRLAHNHTHKAVGAGTSFVQTPVSLFSSGAYPLDWLDCDTKVGITGNSPAEDQGYAWLPKLFMYFIMLPPSMGTVMYFRMVVRHRFEFKDFRTLIPFGFRSEDAQFVFNIREFVPDDGSGGGAN